MNACRKGIALFSCLGISWGMLGVFPSAGFAQQLDTEQRPFKSYAASARSVERYIPPGFQSKALHHANASGQIGTVSERKATTNQSANSVAMPDFSMAKPLTATVTHTLYLPPAMYGEWNVTGTLIESNAPDLFTPNVSDIWLLEREGSQITVTNPVNGANAAISVDKAEGDQATFHRSGTAGKHAIYQEIPTITVHGDTFNGQSLNKIQQIKNGQILSEVYGVYRLEATRISAARARFHPESQQQDPDLEIEEVHR
jgi:hypothetical protein